VDESRGIGGWEVTPETLRKYGWQPIVSDMQAAQLLRHELKHHAAWQQREPRRTWDYRDLLAIKKGNWFTYIKNKHNGYCSILVWRISRDFGGYHE
jgi:hypothetical protein